VPRVERGTWSFASRYSEGLIVLWLRDVANSWKQDFSFYAAKARHARGRRIDPSLTSRPDLLRALRRDGVIIVDGFLDEARVQRIVEEIRARTDLMTSRTAPNIVKRNARYLLLEPQKELPSVNAFFESDLVNGLARAYLSRRAVLDRPAVQLKVDVGQDSIVDFYHIDEWRYLLSAFLFLTDVGPNQAPMIYLKRSHRQSLWRLPKEKEFFFYYDRRPNGEYANEESAYCGCFLPTEARRLRERHGFEMITCTGQAGTLLMFDNLGLHRASVLRELHRLILSGYWMLPQTPAVD
jgi:hypothetical protein